MPAKKTLKKVAKGDAQKKKRVSAKSAPKFSRPKSAPKSPQKTKSPNTQKVTIFSWDERRLLAAQLVAAGEKTEEEICAAVGVIRKTLWQWRGRDEFKARVAEIIEQTKQSLLKDGIRVKEQRIRALEKLFDRISGVITARAKRHLLVVAPAQSDDVDENDADEIEAAPINERGQGVETGMIAVDYKGKYANVPVFKFDAALAREYRETLKHIAQELGEWSEKQEVEQSGAITLQVIYGNDGSKAGS